MQVKDISISIVVPISRMSGRLDLLKLWLEDLPQEIIEVFLIHDIQDSKTQYELEQYLQKNSDQRLHLHTQYFGNPGAARNFGLNLVTGKWVCMWDSDDFPSVPLAIEMIYAADLQDKNVALGQYCNCREGEISAGILIDSTRPLIPQIYFNVGLWRMGIKRERIAETRFLEIKSAEDQCFVYDLNFIDSEIFVFEDFTYQYSISVPNQLTRSSVAIRDIELSLSYLLNKFTNRGKNVKNNLEILLLRQLLTHFKVFGELRFLVKNLRTIFRPNPIRATKALIHIVSWRRFSA